MDRMILATFVYFLVCIPFVACHERSDDCDTTMLGSAEFLRDMLHTFIEEEVSKFSPQKAAITDACITYNSWEKVMEPIYNDCKHYAGLEYYNNENYTRTVAVLDLLCNDPDTFESHKPCLGKAEIQKELEACHATFVQNFDAEISGSNIAPISVIHDRGCDFLNDAINCVKNVSTSGEECSSSDSEYYEEYYRAYVKPWMQTWNCQFDRSWGWIITTGILVALLAVIALFWVAMFLCCRYCCGGGCCRCCGGRGRDSRRGSDDDGHPMERY